MIIEQCFNENNSCKIEKCDNQRQSYRVMTIKKERRNQINKKNNYHMSPYKLCSVVRLSDTTVRGEEEMAGPSQETPLILAIRSTDDFPGGVWNDTPRSTWDQVMKIYV